MNEWHFWHITGVALDASENLREVCVKSIHYCIIFPGETAQILTVLPLVESVVSLRLPPSVVFILAALISPYVNARALR